MFDLIIKNGIICDGTGAPAYRADIGITEDKITYIGQIDDFGGAEVIDAKGRTVTPGFIDPHTHVDLSVLESPSMEPYLKQGVTTVVTGNCGYGMAPQGENTFYGSIMDMEFLRLADADENDTLSLIFDKEIAARALKERYDIDLDWRSFDEFNQKCDELPLGGNLAPLIGYSALRTAVMGKHCLREATEEELQQMESLTRESMEAEAFGLSTGRDPIYLPGPYATDEEMHRILKIVAEYDGIFSSHTFNANQEGEPDRIGGYEEMIRQAKDLPIRINISHVHVMNMARDAEEAAMLAKKTLDYFDQLRSIGIDLSYDVIPSPACADYTHKSFGFFVKPLILMSGSRLRLAENFRVPEFRQMVHQMVKNGVMDYLNPDVPSSWLGELCILAHKDSSLIGKDLLTCGEERGENPLDVLMDIFAEDPDMIADLVSPGFGESVEIFCRPDIAMPCSDGSSYSKETNIFGCEEIPVYPNAMNIGYIPRYLTKYAGQGLEQAVRQATGYVAERFGIEHRGEIKVGNYADIVILDREKLHSYDEEADPLQDPEGIDYVVVNGKIACQDKSLTKAAAGRVLRKHCPQEV